MDFLSVAQILLKKSRVYTLLVSKCVLKYLTLTDQFLDATMAGGIAVPLTPSPLTVIQGESAVLSHLIALVDKSLNVSSSVEVEHFYDAELPPIIINELDNDRFDIIFPPVEYEVSIWITFNRRLISTMPILLDVQRK